MFVHIVILFLGSRIQGEAEMELKKTKRICESASRAFRECLGVDRQEGEGLISTQKSVCTDQKENKKDLPRHGGEGRLEGSFSQSLIS